MTIWNKNTKITGKRIDSTIGKAKTVGAKKISMRKVAKAIDEDRVAIIEVGSPRNPPMNLEYDGDIEIKPLAGVFGPEEEGEMEVRDDHRLWITMGKNEYWFSIYESDWRDPKMPNIDDRVKATFTMDPSQLASLARKADFAKIEAGVNKDGKQTVFVAFYDEKSNFLRGIDLKIPWKGEMATSMFPAAYMTKWDKLGKKAKVRMGDDWPIELTGEDRGVDYRYMLAPRISCTGDEEEDKIHRYSDGYFADDNEREWYMSCNVKPLPRNRNVVEMDRQRILSIYGTPERFRSEVDSIDAPSVPDAIYAMFASCGNSYPRWMIGDYLATVLGPDYKSYGSDEYDVYAKLMARDGMEIYRTARVVSANRKGRAGGRR